MHLFANVDNVGKDGPLVALAVHLGRREEVLLLAARRREGGVRGVEEAVEPAEELWEGGLVRFEGGCVSSSKS